MYIRKYAFTYIYIYIYIYAYIYVNAFAPAIIHIYTYVCIYTYIYTSISIYLYVFVYIYIYCPFVPEGFHTYEISVSLLAIACANGQSHGTVGTHNVSFAKESYKRDDILQKRPIIFKAVTLHTT